MARPLTKKQQRALMLIASRVPFGPPVAKGVRTLSMNGNHYWKMELMCGPIRVTPQVWSLQGRGLLRVKVVDRSEKNPVVNVYVTEQGELAYDALCRAITKGEGHGA
jgi:hypothetical protein